jgi:hypothetical protein
MELVLAYTYNLNDGTNTTILHNNRKFNKRWVGEGNGGG